jgi:hypothetical protein
VNISISADSYRRGRMQHSQGLQVELARVEEAEVPVHLQGVSGHLPLDQERVRDGLQIGI